ncbi:MAG: hypothetical protein HRU19_01765 [Pseudobacteriovorax sp.]|nr:hypothetical protein [Pseudobacteriovorax sp.]
MKHIQLGALLLLAALLSSCQSTKNALVNLGLVEPPFDPDEVTMTIMSFKSSVPSYVAAIRQVHQRHFVVKNFQIRLEAIDKALRTAKSSSQQQQLIDNFQKTFDQRVDYQDELADVIQKLHRAIGKDRKKARRAISLINDELSKKRVKPAMAEKLSVQGRKLVEYRQGLDKLFNMTRTVEKNFESLFDYTLQYDNNHPQIYGQAYETKKQ